MNIIIIIILYKKTMLDIPRNACQRLMKNVQLNITLTRTSSSKCNNLNTNYIKNVHGFVARKKD